MLFIPSPTYLASHPDTDAPGDLGASHLHGLLMTRPPRVPRRTPPPNNQSFIATQIAQVSHARRANYEDEIHATVQALWDYVNTKTKKHPASWKHKNIHEPYRYIPLVTGFLFIILNSIVRLSLYVLPRTPRYTTAPFVHQVTTHTIHAVLWIYYPHTACIIQIAKHLLLHWQPAYNAHYSRFVRIYFSSSTFHNLSPSTELRNFMSSTIRTKSSPQMRFQGSPVQNVLIMVS